MEKVNKAEFMETPLQELIAKANSIRRIHLSDKMELCSIVNAKSGLCTEDCKFCAQSSHHKTNVSVYSLKSIREIVEKAKIAKEIGAKKFGIVTSGNRPTKDELNRIIDAISEINKDVGITACASLGALSKNELRTLKKTGLSSYHHNIETSPGFYSHIVSTHNFQERINTINTAKEVGLEVCSGVIIGMGEDWQDRIDMATLLKELEVDSVPINILVPIKGTKLEKVESISVDDVIRTICIFRIILKDKIIKIAAGRETVLKDSQELGFLAGANGMLIGGYLTVKGREIEEDQALVKEIKELWKK